MYTPLERVYGHNSLTTMVLSLLLRRGQSTFFLQYLSVIKNATQQIIIYSTVLIKLKEQISYHIMHAAFLPLQTTTTQPQQALFYLIN